MNTLTESLDEKIHAFGGIPRYIFGKYTTADVDKKIEQIPFETLMQLNFFNPDRENWDS